MLEFPASPVDGQTFTASNGVSYQYVDPPGIWQATSLLNNATGTGKYVLQDSPELLGDPTAPTPPAGDSDESIATTEFVALNFAATAYAVGDGVANDTSALAGAIVAAMAAGAWLDGRGKTYGVSELSLPVGAKLHDFRFKELDPQGSASRKTVKCLGTGAAGETIALENVFVDRNGDGTGGAVSAAAGLYISDVARPRLVNVEVTGNNAGIGVWINNATSGYVDLYVHDIRYAHTSQIDDTVQGILFQGSSFITGTARVERLGRIDQTTVQRDRYSRGVAYSNCDNMSVYHRVSRVDQGCDVTGSSDNHNVSLAGKYSHVFSFGTKVANTGIACDFHRVEVEHAGYAALTFSGPGGVTVSPTQSVNASGWTARNIGANGFWNGTGIITAGLRIFAGLVPPKGSLIENYLCTSDIGTATFTVLDLSDNILGLTSSLPISTGVRVQLSTTGTLPAPLLTATNYYLIDYPPSAALKLATSYINALDGVAIDVTTAGTGVHSITLQSDCDYVVYSEIPVADFDVNMPNRMRPGVYSGMKEGLARGNVQLLDRELLLADRTYYVRADSSGLGHSGLLNTSAGAFLTVQEALDFIQNRLDLGGKTVTVLVGAGTYTGVWALSGPFTGGGLVSVQGNSVPANVIISTAATAVTLTNRARLRILSFKFTTSAGTALSVQSGSYLEWGDINFGAVAARHVDATSTGSIALAFANYEVSGGGLNHLYAVGGEINTRGRTVTLTGTPAFSSSTVRADRVGSLRSDSMVFVGGATGKRYHAESNGVIDTNGGGANFFPGDVAGTVAVGGVYV